MTEAQLAHFRLSCELAKFGKVRTHYQQPGAGADKSHPKESPNDKRGGNNRREIRVGAKTYRSIGEACQAERISYYTLRDWLACGRATYAERAK